ncbi:hypothetical protein PHISCL_00831 [Aspergillus sclerotialis]|uniref:Uncharacterized protein n=1 Tax=Aspergillus sclerotialis TaxID=2070753 RepID=A0A3A2ZUR6_9EURO|nr:hypothetical protein PHISCL_00831 [Aspergillus sclerotialis]
MKKRSPKTTSNTMERSQLSTISKSAHLPMRNDSAHSHATLRPSDFYQSSSKPAASSRATFTSLDDFEIANLNKASLELLGRDLYEQHLEDTKYLERRREIQQHYRSLVEYDRLRYITELERINASFSFLDRQDKLDRELEERIHLQELKLKKVQRRLNRLARANDLFGEVSNPLFHPELSALK